MPQNRLKMVWYDLWCLYCKYKEKPENEEPCDECLNNSVREETHKPLKFEDKK